MKAPRGSRTLFLSGLLLLAGGAFMLTARAEPTTRPTTRPATLPAGKAANALCPVETDNEVDPRVTIIYHGKIIGFCCTDCMRDFEKDPEKYLRDRR